MPDQLSKNAKNIQTIMLSHGLTSRVMELPKSTRTAEEAASAIGCALSQIVKSLIFKTKDGDEPILLLVSGPNRVNERLVKKHLGEPILKADAAFVKRVTGFTIGGIPPFGHQSEMKCIYIDKSLLTLSDVWAAAGTPHAVFNISPPDLLSLTKGTPIDL